MNIDKYLIEDRPINVSVDCILISSLKKGIKSIDRGIIITTSKDKTGCTLTIDISKIPQTSKSIDVFYNIKRYLAKSGIEWEIV